MELLTFGLCTTIALTSIAALLLNHLYRRERQVIEERKDLLDRLMAKDFHEYVEATQPIERFEPVQVTDEKEYWDEIEARRM